MMTKIVVQPPSGRSIPTSTKHTSSGQRETLESILANLGAALGIAEIEKATSARGSDFYRPMGTTTFQSATNTILELSEKLANRSG